MKHPWPLILLIGAIACDRQPGPKPSTETAIDPKGQWERVEFPTVEDNVRNDTLLVQVTFDLGKGNFLMVAGNVEETRDGLRLYLYHPDRDSNAVVTACSKPGFDSYTMYPTFFSTGRPEDGTVILANMGEKQSWGQEAFWLKDERFIHLGFLDVAQRGWRTYADSLQQWRTSIAERALVSGGAGQFEFSFIGDSLQLYDDFNGHQEVMLPASQVRYRCAAGKTELMINGVPVTPRQPA